MPTDDVCQRIHATPDMDMTFETMRAYHAVITSAMEREQYLNWLQRNDLLFATAMRVVLREADGPEVFKSLAIVLAKECRRLLNELAEAKSKRL